LLTFDGFTGEGECDCSCGVAQALSCSSATFEGRPDFGGVGACNQQCQVDDPDCSTQTIAPATCPGLGFDITNSEVYKVTLGQIQSGSCKAGTPTPQLDPVVVETGYTICLADSGTASCAGGGRCEPAPADDFADTACIFIEGVQDCPEDSPFSQKLVSYRNVDDARDCGDTCACEVEVGEACGVISLSKGASQCLDNAGTIGGGCTANQGINADRATYVVNANDHDCVSAGPYAFDGEPVGSAPITLCCQPQ
jgi:hypothetical protein